MDELNNASKVITGKMDIRIVYLPPVTVAASHYIGVNPEETANGRLADFINMKNLPTVKPDFRIYGFNNPNPSEGQEEYGYETWATIPDDMEVTDGLEKKTFAGGLYAAHCIKMGDFQEWGPFFEQVQKNEEYEVEWGAPEGMGGSGRTVECIFRTHRSG